MNGFRIFIERVEKFPQVAGSVDEGMRKFLSHIRKRENVNEELKQIELISSVSL